MQQFLLKYKQNLFLSPELTHTHHLERDLDVVDQVVLLPGVQGMSLLSHYKNNISRNRVWTLEGKTQVK